MKKYINYDESGKILGFILSPSPTGENIEVTDQVWDNAQGYNTLILSSKGELTFSTLDYSIPDQVPEDNLVLAVQSTMQFELLWADLQLKYAGDLDERAKYSEQSLRSYRVACRNHVRVLDGTLTVVGDLPKRPEELVTDE